VPQLVVGGGTIAAAKVVGLLAAGAEVEVVSSHVLPSVARHAAEHQGHLGVKAGVLRSLINIYRPTRRLNMWEYLVCLEKKK